MDFLSSTFSTLGIGASDYTKESQLTLDETVPTIWQVWQGTVRKDGKKCTIFECTDPTQFQLGNNLVKALKRLRLPGLPKIIGAEQSQKSVLVALERITPLASSLPQLSSVNRTWGLSHVLTTLKHLADAKCIVGNTNLGTIWIDQTGDWVLTGFEIASFPGENSLSYGSSLPFKGAIPPEIQNQGWISVNDTIDTFQFGKLIQAVLPNPSGPIQRVVAQCIAAKRPSIARIDQSAFATPIQPVVDNLAQFQMMNEFEFTQLLRDSGNLVNDFSSQLISGRLLPALTQAYGNNQRGGLELVRLVLFLCERAEPSDQLTAFIISLFSSLDRAVRVELLQQMPNYIGILPDRVVQRNIMPSMAVSFADSEPMMRRESLKSISCLATKVNSRQLNGDLLRLLAKTSNDTEADIRAQTIRVLTQLSEHMEQSTRSSVIVTALAKSLKDPSPDVRSAALEALSTTADYFNPRECAEKLLGPAASSLLDQRHEVRAMGRQIVQSLLDKITTESEKLDQSLEGGIPPPERVVSRDDTPSVAKLFRPGTEVPPPPVPLAPANPVQAPRLDPPKSFAVVEETAVFTNSGWDDWDEDEDGTTANNVDATPVKPTAMPKADLDPELEPEEDGGEDGWGDW